MLKNKLLSAMGGAPANYIEDVFSTWLYTGNGSTQTITNGIDLAGDGGLVWIKRRNAVANHALFDTARGATKKLYSDLTNAEYTDAYSLTSFNADGFSVGLDGSVNNGSGTYASWTFRKQPKFFDVVTFTTDSTTNNNQRISHNLGSTPGCIIVKATSSTSNWSVWHRSLSSSTGSRVFLNTTAASANAANYWGSSGPNATDFGINTDYFGTGATYVAYIFAHDAGGFGLSGTDSVISCGIYTGNGSTDGPVIDLGYEPQWVMIKRTNSTGNWRMHDNMRGMPVDGYSYLLANTSAVEVSDVTSGIRPLANGFQVTFNGTDYNGGGSTYIYIAIRRGPMKTPTSGTSVFAPVSATPSGATTVTTNFPVDLAINAQRDAGTSGNKVFWDRLRGSSTAAGQGLFSTLTNAEVSYSGNGIGLQSNTTIVDNYWNTLNGATTPVIYWNFRRAPGFFDEVCYTGTGSGAVQNVKHNLTAVPELMIVKGRSNGGDSWMVYHPAIGNTKYLQLNSNAVPGTFTIWNNTTPTASVFTVGNDSSVNVSGGTYVAYLFASCPGVSKCGSYTGTGTTQQINCGFTAGARFVLIKRTDSTGDWYVWDSARGIVAGNDPYLLLNSTAAEVTTTDYVDTFSSGFEISNTAPAAINASGGTFIYLAIA